MPSRSKNEPVDVSILVPFRDDEDVVGTACTRLAQHMRGLGLGFELLAIEEDSGDNSHAVLGLLRREIPELRVVYAEGRDRGFATGASEARGRAVLLIDASNALKPLAPVSRPIRRVLTDQIDAAIAPDRFVACHRTRSLDALSAVRGRKLSSLRRRVTAAGGRVEVLGPRHRRWLRPSSRPAAVEPAAESRPFGRLIAALMLPRF